MILNGGVGGIVGITGPGNMFKSTLVHFMNLTVADRFRYSGVESPIHYHDTEDNMIFNYDRLNRLSTRMVNIPKDPLYDAMVWSVIPKSEMSSDKWIELVHKKLEEKIKNTKNYITYEGYINRLNGKPLKIPKQSSITIDSFSEMESGTTENIISDGKIDSSNTMFMQQGLLKAKIMKDLPRLSNNSNTNFILTAHIGDEINMASGPFAPQPTKQLQHMKAGQKMKGVVGKILYLSTHFYLINGTSLLMNQGTKMPEYPMGPEDNSTDLNVIKVKQLRSKTGPSGYMLNIIVSQVEGVLPSLTEFHSLRVNKFGLVGNNVSYSIAIYPDVKLTRPTVRRKLDEDVKLRRAANIMSEFLQMKTFMRQFSKYYIEPEELYTKIKEAGYDWNWLLEHTRGWYTPKQYDTDLYFMSTLDVLRMAAGDYEPYWKKIHDKEIKGDKK